jgi:CheY-like chemotaxis protein
MTEIMVVDDEPDIVFIVKAMLKREGYKVTEALSGEECLEKLEKEKPDLILMDVMMPGLDGWETCKKIKEGKKTKSIPVVMLTVKTGEEDKIRSFQYAHCDGHIDKPIIKEKLINTVKWVLKTGLREAG